MKFSTSAPRDCAGLAPQLTALFDGEADDFAARDARAHLLICPSCSRLWLDWTRHRDTLQSEPIPTPPPTLLWRVLIAYRVAAFAHPARHRPHLPLVSATPLRDIEAPLPPRLSQHILARTTRKPCAHVMLTPLGGPAPVAKSQWKARSFSFRGASLWAAPALALWILMLGRTDFSATLPAAIPDVSVVAMPVVPDESATAKAISPTQNITITPIPVASILPTRVANPARPPRVVTAPIRVAPAPPRARVSARSENVAPIIRVAPTPTALTRARAVPIGSRAGSRPDAGLRRAFFLAMNAGRRDIERARTDPLESPNNANNARVSLMPASAPAVESAPPAQRKTRAARPVKSAPRALQTVRSVPQNVSTARVTLAALASPISPIRTSSVARVSPAEFSGNSLRPRAVHLSAGGLRLARMMPEPGAIPLRVSRPVAGAPTLREASFNNGESGPKLDELRSAVDEFRASVAGDE